MMDLREFERMAAVEDRMWWYVGMRAITVALLERHLPKTHGLRVLDAGCGTGANLAFLRRYGRVTGFDLAAGALRGCRARGEAGVCRASILNIPHADAAFDLATSFDVLFMLPRDAGVLALRELARVTRPGGHVLVRSAAYNRLRGAHDVAWATQHRYSAPALVQLAQAAQLQPVFSSHANLLLLPVAMLKRFAETLFRRRTGSDTVLPPRFFNVVLTRVLKFEAAIIRRAPLPAGLSAMLLARKP